MTREEAAANLLEYLKGFEKRGTAWYESLEMAISALREQDSNTDQHVSNTENALGGWISVEERLPELLTDVLVWDRDWGMSLHAYMTRHNEWCGVIISHKITHWMPLPEPPEENL